jgi:hypothetical protein
MVTSAAMAAAETTVVVTAVRSISTTTARRLTSLFFLPYLPKTDERSDHQVAGRQRSLAVYFQL